jgi:fructoselysine-6-P-deglycase FrlB-like protein
LIDSLLFFHGIFGIVKKRVLVVLQLLLLALMSV